MQIFDIINNLYTNKKSDWIKTIEDTEIQPYKIQRFLLMNDQIRVLTRWLDKYVFTLQNYPKMYLSLAWSIIPKFNKPPFVRYIKLAEEDIEYDFLLNKIKKHFVMSDNDFRANKTRLLNYIKKDANSMVNWFSYYGVPKRIWKKYYLDFNLIKKFNVKEEPNKQKGLGAWGL